MVKTFAVIPPQQCQILKGGQSQFTGWFGVLIFTPIYLQFKTKKGVL